MCLHVYYLFAKIDNTPQNRLIQITVYLIFFYKIYTTMESMVYKMI